MKKKVVILSSVVAVFAVMIIAFKGCNDAVDNGVFEEQAALVAPAEQASLRSDSLPISPRFPLPDSLPIPPATLFSEELPHVSAVQSTGTWSSGNYDVSAVESYGGLGSLLVFYHIGVVNVNTGTWYYLEKGYAGKFTENSLQGVLSPGDIFKVRVIDRGIFNLTSGESAYAGPYRYKPDGKIFFGIVSGGGMWYPIYIQDPCLRHK
ncbi:MAG: hypothetical protein LBE71_04480 [Dysgonamonadaceae bacterium]|jgi:hypothetical protein|nr:hypothetical protein [Dysgonamonadaceae bacterium]